MTCGRVFDDGIDANEAIRTKPVQAHTDLCTNMNTLEAARFYCFKRQVERCTESCPYKNQLPVYGGERHGERAEEDTADESHSFVHTHGVCTV